jgi:hypothetical protein
MATPPSCLFSATIGVRHLSLIVIESLMSLSLVQAVIVALSPAELDRLFGFAHEPGVLRHYPMASKSTQAAEQTDA